MAKFAAVAYALWLVGGWMGLHHLYLHRPHAAFLSVVTLQGLGAAWLYDLLTIPQVVAHTNGNAEYIARLRVAKTFHTQPPLSLLASLVMIFFGTLCGALAACLLPAQWPPVVYELLYAVGTAWGITFSGDAVELETRGALKWVLATVATIVLSAFVYYGGDVDNDDYRSAKTGAIFLGVAVYLVTRRWSPRVDELLLQEQNAVKSDTDTKNAGVTESSYRPAYWRTLLNYWTLLAAFVACGLTAIQFHGVLHIEVDGVVTATPFFEACGNFLKSEAFETFTTTLYDLYQGKIFDEQFHDRWQQFNAKMDLSGRHRYLHTLGLENEASEKEIKAAYRALVLQWHPDKYTGDDSEHANIMFFQIQEAYEKLMAPQSSRGGNERARGSSDEL